MALGGSAGVILSPVLRSSAEQHSFDLEGAAIPPNDQDSPGGRLLGPGDRQGEEVLLHVTDPRGRLRCLHPSHRSELALPSRKADLLLL